jgi:hypothetical protein
MSWDVAGVLSGFYSNTIPFEEANEILSQIPQFPELLSLLVDFIEFPSNPPSLRQLGLIVLSHSVSRHGETLFSDASRAILFEFVPRFLPVCPNDAFQIAAHFTRILVHSSFQVFPWIEVLQSLFAGPDFANLRAGLIIVKCLAGIVSNDSGFVDFIMPILYAILN